MIYQLIFTKVRKFEKENELIMKQLRETTMLEVIRKKFWVLQNIKIIALIAWDLDRLRKKVVINMY